MRNKIRPHLTNTTWTVDFINRSSVPDDEFKNGILTLQKQINRHFLPAWSIGAQLNIADQRSGNATIFVQEDSGVHGVGGFHDVTNTEVPIGFVFVQSAKDIGDSWTFAASHELMEMLVDPYANLAAEGQFNGSPAFFAYEVCDAVEADGGYKLDGIQVSNFVFPSWFINQTALQYDYLGLLDAPFTIGTNGTMALMKSIGHWTDVSNNRSLPKSHPKHSRRFKRRRLSNPNYGLHQNHPEYIHHPQVKD